MILFVNACVREGSRTLVLAKHLLDRLDGEREEICLHEAEFPKVDEAFLQKRDDLIAQEAFGDALFEMARQFAKADEIVIAAPYYDLSFPASLKQYLEQINVLGVTFAYTPEGYPKGLCRAKRLWYVTTAGGAYVPEVYGFGYVKALAEGFYGISDVRCIQAAGLDIDGADEVKIMKEAINRIDTII